MTWSFEEIVSAGEDADVVKHVIGLVDRSEYKRRQAAPGIKITPQELWKGPPDADREQVARLAMNPGLLPVAMDQDSRAVGLCKMRLYLGLELGDCLFYT